MKLGTFILDTVGTFIKTGDIPDYPGVSCDSHFPKCPPQSNIYQCVNNGNDTHYFTIDIFFACHTYCVDRKYMECLCHKYRIVATA